MSEPLDHFIRDALQEHDGVNPSEATTIITGDPQASRNFGTLPGPAVEGLIARGGMGAVYRAREQALEREVAVKVMTSRAETPQMAEIPTRGAGARPTGASKHRAGL